MNAYPYLTEYTEQTIQDKHNAQFTCLGFGSKTALVYILRRASKTGRNEFLLLVMAQLFLLSSMPVSRQKGSTGSTCHSRREQST